MMSLLFGTQYLAPDKFRKNSKPFSKQSLSILNLNIRSINKIFVSSSMSALFVFLKHGLIIQT